MADGLGTPGGVVSDEDHRLAMAGLIAAQTSSLAVRTGVMWGPGSTAIITGTSATGTMTVNVAAHHWVTSRATADGVYLGTKETSTTVSIAAAPGANSRIDVVYAKQNDSASSISPDGSTGELYAVATGTAAASPTKPAIPTGAIELGIVTVAAGATNTLGAGVTIANTAPLTVARGADIPVRNTTERATYTTYSGLHAKRLDNGGKLERWVTGTTWDTAAYATDIALSTGTPITYDALYKAAAGTYLPLSYDRRFDDIKLRGAVTNTGTVYAASAGTLYTIGTLAVGIRPTTDQNFVVSVGSGTGVYGTANVLITGATGLVQFIPQIALTNGFILSFGGVQFRAGA